MFIADKLATTLLLEKVLSLFQKLVCGKVASGNFNLREFLSFSCRQYSKKVGLARFLK
jgi:hypothetical protein